MFSQISTVGRCRNHVSYVILVIKYEFTYLFLISEFVGSSSGRPHYRNQSFYTFEKSKTCDTKFILSDGESISAAKKDTVRSMEDREQELTEYGQRIDLLVSCKRLKATFELCSIKFKKENETASAIMRQQNKNARIYSCILSYIDSLTNDSDNQVLTFTFKGNSGYLTQICCYKNIMYSRKVAELHIPTDILEFDCLKNTLECLYMWKLHLVTLSVKVLKSLYSNKKKYSSVETCGGDIVDSLSRSQSPAPLN